MVPDSSKVNDGEGSDRAKDAKAQESKSIKEQAEGKAVKEKEESVVQKSAALARPSFAVIIDAPDEVPDVPRDAVRAERGAISVGNTNPIKPDAPEAAPADAAVQGASVTSDQVSVVSAAAAAASPAAQPASMPIAAMSAGDMAAASAQSAAAQTVPPPGASSTLTPSASMRGYDAGMTPRCATQESLASIVTDASEAKLHRKVYQAREDSHDLDHTSFQPPSPPPPSNLVQAVVQQMAEQADAAVAAQPAAPQSAIVPAAGDGTSPVKPAAMPPAPEPGAITLDLDVDNLIRCVLCPVFGHHT